ncbi:MAG: serine kinase [Paracoccus sp. (in: a-proteobacteria)]|nr:serine kinase [Paracoccus sp. (in: a-proteobacteria)]
MIRIHASAVAIDGRALVILGPSGTGKSSLALQLLAVGAILIADDQTELRRDGRDLRARAPDALRGRIEARGVGILSAATATDVSVVLACDLGAVEGQRLPPWRQVEWLGVAVPLVLGPYRPHLYAALRQMLTGGRMM